MPDDLATLRRMRPDLLDVSPDAVDSALRRARARLEVSPATGAPRRMTPGRAALTRRRTALVGLTATVAASAIVGTGIGVTHLTAPESAAASTLHAAARAASASPRPSGSFTRVTTTENALGYATSDGSDYDEGYVFPLTSITWIPEGVSGTWTRESWSGPATTFYGGAAARRAAAEDYATSAHRDNPETERATGGDFTNGELGGTEAGTLTASDIADLPRDPQALTRRIEAAPGDKGATSSEHVFDTISQLLRTGLVPADLRAGMFEALANLPEIVIADRQTTLDGRRGTALGLNSAQGLERHEVIIDQVSGAYLGERTLQTKSEGSIPAGTAIDSVSVTSTPTNRLP